MSVNKDPFNNIFGINNVGAAQQLSSQQLTQQINSVFTGPLNNVFESIPTQEPSPAVIGSIYYDAVGNVFKIYDGAQWIDLKVKDLALSFDEQKELNELIAERAARTKQTKVDAFKKLSRSLRQSVVDYIAWKKESTSISALEAEKSARQKELETRQAAGNAASYNPFGGQRIGNIGISTAHFDPMSIMGYPHVYGLPSIQGLSEEELINAHAEACMEEEVLASK